jgi:hypothetical protein
MDLTGKRLRERPTVTGLAKLARNLRIVIPTVITITLLLLLFQQDFSFFDLPAKFF